MTGVAEKTVSGDTQTASPRPLWMLISGAIALVVFAAFAVHVAMDPEHPFTQAMDDAWRGFVGSDHGPETGVVPMFFQYLGEGPGALLLMIIVPVALVIVRRWRSAIFFFTANLAVSGLVSQVTKNLVHRPRPAADIENGLFGPLFSVDHGSFPSGHSITVGFVIVGVAALITPGKRLIWWCIAPLLAVGIVWQRTLINAHWLSDTLFGVIAGAAGTLIVWWAFWPMLQKDYGKPPFGRRIETSAEGES